MTRARTGDRRARLVVVLVVAIVTGLVPAAPAVGSAPVARSAVWLDGEHGDYIYGGRSTTFEAPAFLVRELGSGSPDPASLRIRVETAPGAAHWTWYDIHLAAPVGQSLVVGAYTGATRAPFRQGANPGIDVGGDGRGCNETRGDFTVHEYARNDDGSLRAFAASFRQWCSSTRTGSKLIGEVRFGSSLPMPAYVPDLHMVAMPPQLVGTESGPQAITVQNTGATTLTGNASFEGAAAAEFAVSSRDDCLVNGFAPGQSCVLEVRYVPAAQGARTAFLALTIEGVLGPRRWTVTGSGRSPTTTTVTVGAGSDYPGVRLVTASVTPASATGGVRFLVDGQPVARGGLVSGRATEEIPLPPGASTVTAEYLGTNTWEPSSSADAPYAGLRASGVRMAAERVAVAVGEPIDVLATVLVGGTWPMTGTIRLVDRTTGTELASGPIADASPELLSRVVFFAPGTHTLEAVYSGDSLTPASRGSIDITVAPVVTTLALEAPSAVHFPAPASLVARVSPVPDGGVVTFRTAAATLGTAAVDALTGVARFDFEADPGAYRISASYGGTASFAGSGSREVSVASRFATRVAITALPSTACLGEPVDLGATVSALPSGAPAAGRLVLRDGVGGTFLASADVTSTNRAVTFTTSSLGAGAHTIEATFSGGGDYDASRATVVVTVRESGDCVPPAGSVRIDGGSSYTRSAEVTLTLSATDPAPSSGVTHMRFSSTGTDGSWTGWIPFATSHSWVLAGADGSKWVHVQFRDAAGNVSHTASAGVVLDRTPAVESVPTHRFAPEGTMGSTVPVTVTYPARDALSGVAGYRLDQSADAGLSYLRVALPSATTSSVTRSLAAGTARHRFRANAQDRAGNTGALLAGPAFSIFRFDEVPSTELRYSGTWTVRKDAALFGGSERYSSAAGARATFSFTGSRIALVAQRGPYRGLAEVWIDGRKSGTVNLYAATAQVRRIVFSGVVAAGTHALELRVLGTKAAGSRGTSVGLDAILVAR